MKKRVGVVLAVLAFVACQREKTNSNTADTTTNKHHFTQLYVRYLEPEQQIKATASFYEGDSFDTARPLLMSDGVRFQGYPMVVNDLPRTKRYLYNGVGDYPNGGFTFQFKDWTGNEKRYVLQLDPIQDFSLQSTPAGMRLVLEGAPLKPDETLVLLFTDEKNQTYSAEAQVPADSREIPLPSDLMAQLPKGKEMLYLVKKKTIQTTEGNTEVTAAIEYYSKLKEVPLVK